MKVQVLKWLLFLNLFFLTSLLILPLWYTMEKSLEKPRRTLMQTTDACSLCRQRKDTYSEFCARAPQSKAQPEKDTKKGQKANKPATRCKNCSKKIIEMLKPYSQAWKRHEKKHYELKIQLNLKVNGSENAIITQLNTPMGTIFPADGQKGRSIKVKEEHFETFLKVSPFGNKTYGSCAVVGNAGILTNSSCGEMIDSAEFVIRCNLPPLRNGYEPHVGVKTNLVSANPSILSQNYGSLLGSRRKFMEKLCQYGDAMILLPGFSYVFNVPVCTRVFHTIKDYESPMKPIYFSPNYLKDLDMFWRTQGWNAVRLSTGMIMTSMALELCDTVHLYGFWPFNLHPESFKELTNHYYDDKRPKGGFHAMPDEFKLLLELHSKGVLKLHLGDCKPTKSSPK